ncbi:hypothetical protein KTE13_27770 [Burkholderia multivorans]|uniref:hypothetical protein n=1 Tax=Burkholderia multivorans TaxID=87883 RepID=UPI001C22F7A9|nr:hypothetical protein [Burkholderia multivorans]MBU9403545.1 hypothetical protein [Burkholderia multivorans]
MDQMTESSTFKRPDWPLGALPQHWVEALFSKMAAFYGSRFAAMWTGVNVVEVQKAWAVELGKLSREQLKAGSDNLTALPKPPTLPEFVSLCRQARSEQAALTTLRLADERPADRATVESNLGAIRSAQERFMSRMPTAEWAFKLLLRGKSSGGSHLPSGVVRRARDAIASPAGAKAIATCSQPDLRRDYEAIREAVLSDLMGVAA